MSCSLPTLYNVQSQEKILDTRVKRRMWGRENGQFSGAQTQKFSG